MAKTVLVVDDEPLIRLILSVVLGEAGFHVVEAKDGAEARARLTPAIAAVVLDITLPDANGLDLLRRFKAERFDLPIILITGEGPELEARAVELGADGFLNKPFGAATILAAVERLTGRALVEAPTG